MPAARKAYLADGQGAAVLHRTRRAPGLERVPKTWPVHDTSGDSGLSCAGGVPMRAANAVLGGEAMRGILQERADVFADAVGDFDGETGVAGDIEMLVHGVSRGGGGAVERDATGAGDDLHAFRRAGGEVV